MFNIEYGDKNAEYALIINMLRWFEAYELVIREINRKWCSLEMIIKSYQNPPKDI